MNFSKMKILMMTRIHAYKFILVVLMFFSAAVCAQQKNSSEKADTIHTNPDSSQTIEHNNVLNTFSFTKNFSISSLNDMPLDKTSIMLQTRLRLVEMISEDPIKTNFKSSILNPLHQAFVESQSMKELKYILGMVQAGAVGYMAYQHLKKYGFLKRK